MKNNSFRQTVDDRLAGLSMSDALRGRIMQAATDDVPAPKRSTRRKRRMLISALAATFTLAFGLTVAAYSHDFEVFIENMGEDFRQLVQPLSGYSISEGVRMNVVAAVNDGESIVTYITIQDEKGTRIDENTELCDVSAGNDMIHIFDGMVHYDDATHTATYRLTLNSTEALSGEAVSLSVNTLLTGHKFEYGVPTGLTLADLSAFTPTTLNTESINGYSITSPRAAADAPLLGGAEQATGFEAGLASGTLPTLQQNEHPMPFAALQGITVSNAGIVDGYLHVQTYREEGLPRFNWYDFQLYYPGMENKPPLVSADFAVGEYEQLGYHTLNAYHENVFEIPAGVAPEDIQLTANITSYENIIPGEWKVSFIPEVEKNLSPIACNIDMNGWVIHSVTLSSIGVTLSASGEMNEHSYPTEIEVWMKDGTLADINGNMVSMDNDSLISKLSFSRPIRIEDVDKIILNGHVLQQG